MDQAMGYVHSHVGSFDYLDIFQTDTGMLSNWLKAGFRICHNGRFYLEVKVRKSVKKLKSLRVIFHGLQLLIILP